MDRLRLLSAFGGLALAGIGCQSSQDLEIQLRDLAASYGPRELAIAYRDLGTQKEVTVNADVTMHAASTMKVPVMIELFRQAEQSGRGLDTMITVRNRFRSLVDGSPYDLDPTDDSDAELYALVGTERSTRDLMRRMIVRSSNLATNLLIEAVDAKRVTATVRDLGAHRMTVLRGVEDDLAYRRGLSNTTTARDLMILMAAIAQNRAAAPDACREMIAVLSAQEFNDLIPAGLPPETPVAHKTGWIKGIRHDAAIVFPKTTSPYVLVVLTRGFEDPKAAARAIVRASQIVYQHRAR